MGFADMPGYFSEIRYAGGKPTDFIEMVVPVGTDVSGYTIVIYNSTGAVSATFSLGGIVSTSAGGDVYLLDTNTPGFSGIGQNEGFALVDDLGNVLQFISVNGTQITAVEGPADGLTSTSIGANAVGESLETDDDGASYYVQPTPNPGIIQCYAPGTMIDTPDGARR